MSVGVRGFVLRGTVLAQEIPETIFFQDSVLVVQRLLELKKENFEIAIYPLDPHGFVHPESWLDEYRRIYKLMDRHLNEHVDPDRSE